MALSALASTGCSSGDNKELSRETSRSLRAELNQVSSNLRSGNCTAAGQAAADLQAQISELPADVSSKLQRALASSTDRLAILISDQCRPASAPAQDTTTTPAQVPAQDKGGKKEKQQKQDKAPKKDNQQNQEPQPEVSPKPDEGNGTTSPDQQDGGNQSPQQDTGGATPDGG